MIRGRVDEGRELFVRNRLRVTVESDHGHDGRLLFYADRVEGEYRHPTEFGQRPVEPTRWPGWYDPHLRAEDGGFPEGASPFVLDCQRDVAHAVYKALQEHFENETPVPTAGDRAYGDARTDITRLHELLDSTIGALINVVEQ